jgi:hypothetical protein
MNSLLNFELMIFSLLFYAFLAYLLYRLIFNFIIPIYKTTRQVKRSFRNMQDQMRQHTDPQGQPSQNPQQKKPSGGKVGDYIDFEEVKD